LPGKGSTDRDIRMAKKKSSPSSTPSPETRSLDIDALRAEIRQAIDAKLSEVYRAREALLAKRAEIERELASLDALILEVDPTARRASPTSTDRGEGRKRRGKDELRKDAETIVSLIRKGGGAMKTLKPQLLALGIDYGASLPAFVFKHAGIKIKAEGNTRAIVYSVDE